MPWVNVSCFDRDVKVGDKVTRLSTGTNVLLNCCPVVIGILKHDMVLEYPDYLKQIHTKSTDWLVWREPKRWEPSLGEIYYSVELLGVISMNVWKSDDYQRLEFSNGNVWRYEEQAREYADECKKVAERLHERWGE